MLCRRPGLQFWLCLCLCVVLVVLAAAALWPAAGRLFPSIVHPQPGGVQTSNSTESRNFSTTAAQARISGRDRPVASHAEDGSLFLGV